MTDQCLCDDAEIRERKTRDGGELNGIEYIEVGGSGIRAQRLLAVRCLLPVPEAMQARDVKITGGVRADTAVNPVRVLWAFPAAVLPSKLDSVPDAAEREEALALAEPDRSHTLLVRTSSSGDFSTYRLVVDKPELWEFDPCLAAVAFTFKIDCPTGFDPAPKSVPPVRRALEPMIDYLNRDYDGLRRLLLDRMSVVVPRWTDRNAADVGVMLVELFAYLGDHLSYAQDAVCAEAYLGTARRRISVARHARLLDYQMHQGVAARGWLVLEAAPYAPAKTLEAGREVRDTDGGLVFHTLHAVTPSPARNAIDFYTWSKTRCVLPAGATQADLVDTKRALDLKKGDVLVFEEVLGEDGGTAGVDATHRCVVRLSKEPQQTEDPVTNTKLLTITWHDADALPFPLRLWLFNPDFTRDRCPPPNRCTAVARGNVVLAEHGRRIGPEAPDPEEVPDGAGVSYRPALRRQGLTYAVPYRHEVALTQPAASALDLSPREALPQIVKLTGGQADWTLRRDLLATSRFESEFVVEMDDEARAYLRFGDDVLGRRPKPRDKFSVTYLVGGGRSGNCGRDVLRFFVEPEDGLTVRNPMQTKGGVDAETPEQVRQNAPQAFRVQERAVTDADYVMIAQRDRRVQRAAATRRWTGSWYTEFVTVDRSDDSPVDEAFQGELAGILDQYRMAGMDVEVDVPMFVPLDIRLTIQVADGHFRERVKQALYEEFSSGDLAGGKRGFFHPDNFTFAQPVYLSDLVATAMSVTGVSWVRWASSPPGETEGNRFRRWGQADAGEREQGYLPMGRLEIARCDSDPNQPEHGRIDFIMVGGE